MNRPALIDEAMRLDGSARDYVEAIEKAAGDDFRVNRIGASHKADPDASREAAWLNFPRSGNQRRRVLEALAARLHGATFEQLIEDTGIKSAAKRLTELKAGGWAFATGTTRTTSMGAPAEVYLASAKALHALEAERSPLTTAGGQDSTPSRDVGSVRDEGCSPAPPVSQPSADHDEPVSLFSDEPAGRSTSHHRDVEAA